MAIRKAIKIEGTKVIRSSVGEFTTGSGTIEETAYVKIARVNADKNAAVATVSFAIPQGTYTKTFKFDLSLEGSNFIAQAYAHLKTLEEFSGAEDC